MRRSLLPLFLASLGFILIALVINMPLFEWQISDTVTNLPREVQFKPSPWITKFGESLTDDSYIEVYIPNEKIPCRPERLSSTVRRSRIDEVLEEIALNINKNIIPWLSDRSAFGFLLFLCGMYIWWFTIRYKRPAYEAIISTVVAFMFLGVLINVWRLFFHKIGSPLCLGLQGTITLSAALSKIHYETLIVFLGGILLELGALGVMVRAIIKAISESKVSTY